MANPSEPTPRCWREWCLTMQEPAPEKRLSIIRVHCEFSYMRAWLLRTAWMYRAFRPKLACVVVTLDKLWHLMTYTQAMSSGLWGGVWYPYSLAEVVAE